MLFVIYMVITSSENRRLWDEYVTPLPFELFIKDSEYSHGSVRDQLVHIISVDEVWFSELRGNPPLEPLPPSDVDDREAIRAHWDHVEQGMREYLADLRDDILFRKTDSGTRGGSRSSCLAGAAARDQSRHRSPRPAPPPASRPGSKNNFPGFHILRLRSSEIGLKFLSSEVMIFNWSVNLSRIYARG